MSRIPIPSLEELSETNRKALQGAAAMMGFVANDALLMAKNPPLASAFSELVIAIYRPGKVDPGLKRLIGLISSAASGCRYCVGHTAHTSKMHGVGEEKLAAVWNFETSELFDEAERSALRVALHAGQSPNGVTDEMFAELAKFFDVDAQLEIVAVIAMFGFLNRWNSTLAMDLEAEPQSSLNQVDETLQALL